MTATTTKVFTKGELVSIDEESTSKLHVVASVHDGVCTIFAPMLTANNDDIIIVSRKVSADDLSAHSCYEIDPDNGIVGSLQSKIFRGES